MMNPLQNSWFLLRQHNYFRTIHSVVLKLFTGATETAKSMGDCNFGSIVPNKVREYNKVLQKKLLNWLLRKKNLLGRNWQIYLFRKDYLNSVTLLFRRVSIESIYSSYLNAWSSFSLTKKLFNDDMAKLTTICLHFSSSESIGRNWPEISSSFSPVSSISSRRVFKSRLDDFIFFPRWLLLCFRSA